MALASSLSFASATIAHVEPAEFSEESFAAIRCRFESPLLQFATRIMNDREGARDVVQETLMQWCARKKENHPAPAKWLFTVCRNRALNVCRKERRKVYVEEEFFARREDEAPLPNEQLEAKEASGFLLRILETLPARQQEVLQLKFQNDLSYQEISEITELSVNYVGVLIHEALKTLRERYARTAREFVQFRRGANL